MLEKLTETVFYLRRDTESSKCRTSDTGVCSSFNSIQGFSLLGGTGGIVNSTSSCNFSYSKLI